MFSEKEKDQIKRAIEIAEQNTSGEVVVHLRKKCAQDVLLEAKNYFVSEKLHHNPHQNTVLIFIATESKRFAILGDAALHTKVDQAFWERAAQDLQSSFVQQEPTCGILHLIEKIRLIYKTHFPATHHANAIANAVSED